MRAESELAGILLLKPDMDIETPGFRSDPTVRQVLGCAIKVHRELGPGLLESAYTSCLSYEFVTQGVKFKREVRLPVVYDGHEVECGYCADFLIDARTLLEIKSVERLAPIHSAQVITYLRLAKASQALLINFNSGRLMDGVKSFLPPLARPSSAGIPVPATPPAEASGASQEEK